jgi:Rrf2 family protein
MIKLSRRVKYGIRLLRGLNKTEVRSLRKVAIKEKLPEKFGEQIANELRQAGLIKVKRGRGGGYVLAKSLKNISAWEVMEVLDETIGGEVCLSGGFCPHAAQCGQKEMLENWVKENKKYFKKINLEDLK